MRCSVMILCCILSGKKYVTSTPRMYDTIQITYSLQMMKSFQFDALCQSIVERIDWYNNTRTVFLNFHSECAQFVVLEGI